MLEWLQRLADERAGRPAPSSPWRLVGSLAASAAFIALLYAFFGPRWETNDDIAMAMVAHGYGLATVGSPNLFFSNVLWGHLVQAIPTMGGTSGYAVATIGVLVLAGAAVVYGLRRFGAGYVACGSALVLLLARPALFPQFTLNAGLLLIGAIVCWHLYARRHDRRALWVGGLFAFASYLVRGEEFLLVLLVALPLLPWRTLLSQRAAQVASLLLFGAIASAAWLNQQAYQGPEWKPFMTLNSARAPFTDFGAGDYLKQQPAIMARHGYSPNDVDLLQHWFFVDPKLAAPHAMQAMLTELGPLPAQGNKRAKARLGLQALWHPTLLPLMLAALLLAILRPSWRTAAAWGLCVAAAIALGLSGRPAALRVYMPLACLLVLAPYLVAHASAWRNRLAVGVLLVAAVFNASQVFAESKALEVAAEQDRQAMRHFPTEPVVIWGAAFPFEAVYPVLGAPSAAMAYRFYGLGVFTLAPFSVAFAEDRSGRGMIDRLASESGVPIIGNEQVFGLLDTYCRSRLHGRLEELSAQPHGTIVVSRRRCEVAR